MSPTARARAAQIAVAAAFAASAAWLFVAGDERGGSLPYFLAWVAVHLLYGVASGSFWVLPIVVTCPPLFAIAFGEQTDAPVWLQAGFVEVFYGVPVAFVGVVARRLRELRRRPELPDSSIREQHGE